MSETMGSASDAAKAIASVEHFEDGLRRRTEGITWMVWGLVFGGLAMSYYAGDLARASLPDPDAPRPWTLLFPWSPWMLAGGLVTLALWRSAALHTPNVARPWWVNLAGLIATGIGMWLLFIASWFLPRALQQAVTMPTLVGVTTLILLATPLLRLTPAGRRVGFAAALTQTLAGIVLGLAYGDAPTSGAYLSSAIILGGTWLAAGLWETTRG